MGRGQELLDAARKGDRSTVEKIIGQISKRSGPFPSIRRGPGVNVKDDNGYTPLHHACLNGYEDIVQLLLSAEASPCTGDKAGATPLHMATFNGHSRVVAILLQHNNPPVNIDQLTLKRETALMMAVQFGHTEVVAMLVSAGADVTIQNREHLNVLALAAQFDRKDVVRLLLRQPQLIDQYKMPVRDGIIFTQTPLHLACQLGRDDIVWELLRAGVDPNLQTEKGTPLHVAAYSARVSVVRLLLNEGADLKVRNMKGKTVMNMLADYPEKDTRAVRQAIQDFRNQRSSYDSDIDVPRFPLNDSPPAQMTAPRTQEISNKNESFLPPSSSSLTKIHPQSFVKKLASKCLGLKAKFNSAPNISNNIEPEVDVASKRLDQKNNTSNTLLIGNSKFFKILTKKEESGDIDCTDEFDTISLDRLGTLNRDSVVNRSNRSCPGFKTSLPNISENNEFSDQESIEESLVKIDSICDNNENKAVNETLNTNLTIFEPRDRFSIISNKSTGSTTLINECYESYEFKDSGLRITNYTIPRPLPRPNAATIITSEDLIYENVTNIKPKPTPAARTHIPLKVSLKEVGSNDLYENVTILRDKKPEPPKRTLFPNQIRCEIVENDSSRSVSRSSSVSSDSMVDESNLEDILLSAKSKSFRHGQVASYYSGSYKSSASRTKSNVSDSSVGSDVSAIENVDCSEDVSDRKDGDENKAVYLSMTGTLPNKKSKDTENKKVLFRHKTFTNMEVDRNSVKIKDLPQWNNQFKKETLAHYHIRGTGHCIYKAPTVQEFMYIFNRDTLYKDVPPFNVIPNDRRDSYYETAICFCKPKPPKHHNSAEDLLSSGVSKNDEEKVSIDMEALRNRHEIFSTSFKCFCESGTCKLHSNRRESLSDLVVRFSAMKKSISTPDITLDHSPYPTSSKSKLSKNMSIQQKLEDPYAVTNIQDIVERNKSIEKAIEQGYVLMSHPSTLSSNSSGRPYSIKDIAEVISLNRSISTVSTASDVCLPVRKSSSSEFSGHWSLQSCNSNVTIKSDISFKSCIEESSDDGSDGTLHSEDDSDAETIKSDISTAKRPWLHSDSFRFGSNSKPEIETIAEENQSSFEDSKLESMSSKFESGISVEGSESTSSGGEDDSGIPRCDTDMSLGASLERGSVTGGVRSGSGRRRWDDMEGTSEGDALSISSAASSCAPLHLMQHYEHSKVSPTPPKKPPRRNLSVSPTHANSPSSGYSYELRPHARSQDDLDDIQGAKHYLKHGRSVDQYDRKLSYSEHEENQNSPRVIPIPYPRPSLKQRPQPVAITAMYENVAVKEQNPRRKLRRNIQPGETYEPRMNDRVRKYSNQERSSLESLLDDQSMNSPSDCERNSDGSRIGVPLSPSHYEQPPTPDHPPPSAKQAENSIHERIRPLSQLIMEVVEEIRIRKKSQGDLTKT